jgi:hypothetical protein
VYTVGTDKLQVEQVSVPTLTAGGNVVVAHTQHDTAKSGAPVVQIIHENKVRTSGIKVTVVSSTQLRLTSLGEAFSDLKVNMFFSPVP